MITFVCGCHFCCGCDYFLFNTRHYKPFSSARDTATNPPIFFSFGPLDAKTLLPGRLSARRVRSPFLPSTKRPPENIRYRVFFFSFPLSPRFLRLVAGNVGVVSSILLTLDMAPLGTWKGFSPDAARAQPPPMLALLLYICLPVVFLSTKVSAVGIYLILTWVNVVACAYRRWLVLCRGAKEKTHATITTTQM